MFLRNFWYCAAWSSELKDKPLGRTILGEKLVLFRDEAGRPAALGDICPHRFAPLHAGKVVDGAIQCPYHGLRFDASGACALNPHSAVGLPRLRVPSYLLVERHAVVWIWMGDPDAADERTIPALTMHDDPEFVCSFERTPVACHYEMLNDNLLDFTHVEFLHPFLAMEKRDYELEVDDRSISQITQTIDQPKSGAFQMFWPDGPERINSYTTLRWEAPSNMVLTVKATPGGQPDAAGVLTYNTALITPETATTSHYFWSLARDFRRDVPGYTEEIHAATAEVIAEDGWILGEAQKNMGDEHDIVALRAVTLPSDKWGMGARLRLKQLLRAERSAAQGAGEASGGGGRAGRAAPPS